MGFEGIRVLTKMRINSRAVCWRGIGVISLVVLATALLAQDGTQGSLQLNVSENERVWAEDLEHKAAQGSAEAQFEISQAFMDGHVFRQSLPQSVKWLRASAEQGFPEAEANMGGLYYLGQGLPRDYSQAVFWSQKAADHGNVKGEYNLGLMCALGQGVKKSNEQAVHWYLKSAEQGHQVAAYSVGIAYWYGMGIAQDQIKGYMWLLLAQRFGWAQSQKALDALGAKLDPARKAEARGKAIAWLRAHPNVKGVGP
jgi:TPR repeat protein